MAEWTTLALRIPNWKKENITYDFVIRLPNLGGSRATNKICSHYSCLDDNAWTSW